jgi:hexosaminidase
MVRSLMTFLAAWAALGYGGITASAADFDLAVGWALERNFAEADHRARFTITNHSTLTLDSRNWAMYWNMVPRAIRPESITAPVRFRWINGDFYELKLADDFELAPGDSLTFSYTASHFMIKESDAPAGVYSVLTATDGSTRFVPVTDLAISAFERPEQINRSASDEVPIPDAEWLYHQNARLSWLAEDELDPIIPTPRMLTRLTGNQVISTDSVIHYQPGLEQAAALLAARLGLILTGPPETRLSDETGPEIIALQLEETDVEGTYTLQVNDGVTIAGAAAGVFYGSQSLLALVPVRLLGAGNRHVELPAVRVHDRPAFGYRGMFVDISRNFNSPDTMRKLVDIMAFYKLNTLHLHLSEDEAWRIEIEELPELTEVGSRRGHTLDDAEYLQPAYGSGPFAGDRNSHGNGYFTRAQYKELIRYARDRHIRVVPEINVPGHSRAAIKAMEARYRRLMAAGDERGALEYRLIDPADTSEYLSAQYYTDNVINVCQGSAFRFVSTVIDDILEMHEEAGVPLEFFHTGGDEVPDGAWTGSPICADYLEQHPEIENPRNLQTDFFRQVSGYLAAKGIKAAGWEEIAQTFTTDGRRTVNPEFAHSNVVPYVWNALWGAEDLANRMANIGYPTVLASVTNLYFDLAYSKDPREPGLYWAGFVDTEDAFSFTPYHLFHSIRESSFGRPYTDEDFAGLEKLQDSARARILGFQAQLWSETIKGPEMLERAILPKLLGLAERAWHGPAAWASTEGRQERDAARLRDWNRFANALGRREFVRLDFLDGGYKYRLPPPGAAVVQSQVHANSAYPGLEIRYTLDGSDPTPASLRYNGPIETDAAQIRLSTFDTRGRASLPTVLNLKGSGE